MKHLINVLAKHDFKELRRGPFRKTKDILDDLDRMTAEATEKLLREPPGMDTVIKAREAASLFTEAWVTIDRLQRQLVKVTNRERDLRRGGSFGDFKLPDNERVIHRFDAPFRQWKGYTALFHTFDLRSAKPSTPVMDAGFGGVTHLTLGAIARCDIYDTFDAHTGYKLARKRIMRAWQKFQSGALIHPHGPIDGVHLITEEAMKNPGVCAETMYRQVGNCG